MKVSNVQIDQAQFEAAELSMAASNFTLRDFQAALEDQQVPSQVSYEAAKRHLQSLRRSGQARFDKRSERWWLAKTLPLVSDGVAHSPVPSEDWSNAGQNQPLVSLGSRLKGGVVALITLLTCIVSIGALVFINATFAWEFAETRAFQYALVAAFMACDLLRPLLVARGLFDMGSRRVVRGFLGIFLALSLAPLSVLSSTTVLSATMQLGAEQTTQTVQSSAYEKRLATYYDQLERKIAQLWASHSDECARGGCGVKAQAIEQAAVEAQLEANQVLTELGQIQTARGISSFTSRTVEAFKALGLFGQSQIILLPLGIALTLELAALFGPALLLAHRRNLGDDMAVNRSQIAVLSQ